MNALELLKRQHEKVTKELETMHEIGGTAAQVRQVADELVAHMLIEEHIFYPQVKALIGKETFNESFEEHAVGRWELGRLLTATGEEIKTRALVLKEILEHHIEEEEEEMFPKVERAISAPELEALGARMKSAFETAVKNGYEACLEPPPSFIQQSNGGTARA